MWTCTSTSSRNGSHSDNGWPNACRTQSGMRTLRFMCQWCERMTTGIVDPSIKRNVIF
jgi:hypothetical protein